MAARYPSPDQNAAHPFYANYVSVDPAQEQQTSHISDHNVRPAVERSRSHAVLQNTNMAIPSDNAEIHVIQHMINQQYPDSSYPQYSVLPDSAATPETAHGVTHISTSSGPSNALPQEKERKKLSRACDECRRKKIRCDAIDETGAVPCTPCQRASWECSFRRQQQKRGPNKGYINGLAKRVAQLEQQVQDPAHSANQRFSQHQAEVAEIQSMLQLGSHVAGASNTSVLPEPHIGDKRTFAMIEDASPASSRDASSTISQAWHNHTQLSPELPWSQQPFWHPARLASNSGIADLPFEPPDTDETNPPTVYSFPWDKDVIAEYYRLIHQTFPLLPNSETKLKDKLAECPTNLREAFLSAIDCLTRTFPTSRLSPSPAYHVNLKKAAEGLAKHPFDTSQSRTPSANLVYLQTLLLMVMETDNHGPATIRGQAGPSRAEWLGRAAEVAGQLGINIVRSGEVSDDMQAGDWDSEARLARRVWWVLFILDRWHASSTADLLKLPENSVVLLPKDQSLLGESTYHLARLSFIIGHLATILTTTKTPSTDVMAPSNPASSLLTLTLAGEVDRFRESVESELGSLNLVHLSYHHVHLLIKRLNLLSGPGELVGHAAKVATILNSPMTPITPLNHQFAALSAMTLCELVEVRETRDEAIDGLKQLQSCLGEGRGLAGSESSEGWDGAVRHLVVQKLERVAREGENDAMSGSLHGDDEVPFDPTRLTKYGYLTALAQGMVKI